MTETTTSVLQSLPKTSAEWAEVEAAASKGPGAVYAWAWGADSFMAKNTADMTWQGLNESDPVAGCHHLIEALQKSQVQSN